MIRRRCAFENQPPPGGWWQHTAIPRCCQISSSARYAHLAKLGGSNPPSSIDERSRGVLPATLVGRSGCLCELSSGTLGARDTMRKRDYAKLPPFRNLSVDVRIIIDQNFRTNDLLPPAPRCRSPRPPNATPHPPPHPGTRRPHNEIIALHIRHAKHQLPPRPCRILNLSATSKISVTRHCENGYRSVPFRRA